MKASHRRNQPALEPEENPTRVAEVLIQGIANYSAKEEGSEYKQFRARLQQIVSSLGHSPSYQEQIDLAESTISLMRDHNHRLAKRQHLQTSELRVIIQMLMKTLEDLSVAGPERMRELKAIGSTLDSTTDPEQLRFNKASLANCLAEVTREAHRQFSDAGADSARDSATKLRPRSAGEAALAEACTQQTDMCAAVFMVDRLPLFNRRYGRECGDKVLHFFATFVKHAFEADTAIFRWTGPALLMLLPGPLDRAQAEVRTALEPKLQFEFEIGSRTILLCVDTNWSLFPLMVDPRLLINKIDAFVT